MSVTLPVYLDNHATTKPDPEVVEAMLPYLRERYGNASSSQHEFGWVADAAIGVAREQVALLIGATAAEIVFSSGATESINLALKGVAAASPRRRIITVASEHRAVLDTCRTLNDAGYDVVVLPVDSDGLVSVRDLEDALTADTIMVSVMMANNEVGTIAPVAEIGALCRSRGVLFHTDATQAAGKIPLDVRSMNIDLLSLSAHKMHGVKGAGALYVRRGSPQISIVPQIDGGGHERGLRSGTLNVPAVVAFGKAAELARERLRGDAERMRALRDMLLRELKSRLEGVHLNGHPVLRLPNNANLSFEGVTADRLMMEMKDVAVSTGSACSSASPEPSHVLRALGLSRAQLLSSVRFGLSRWTTEEEIRYVARRVVESVGRLRERILAGVVANGTTRGGER